MKKIIASSDPKLEGRFLPAETLWKAAQIVRQKGVVDLQLTAEPKPHEILGLTIGMVRRRKQITLNELADKTGFSIEELLAFEAGLLPVKELIKYLPAILREVKISRKSIRPLLQKIRAA
ncbi:MAG: hypothetical protein OHK003_26000 [Anaerolineales bacterium]